MTLYIDTGGTFTDTLALDATGKWHRLKVLSSSALRLKCKRFDQSWIYVDRLLVPHSQCLLNYSIYSAEDGMNLGDIQEISEDGLAFKIELVSGRKPNEDEILEIRSPEQVPVFVARLLTGTLLSDPLPHIQMRLATTKGTNALLERKGVPPILITNKGLGDLPLIGTQQRPDLFALHVKRAAPMHAKVIEIGEDGITLPDNMDQVTPVAIALRNSFQDDSHERAIEKELASRGIHHISRSSKLAPLIRLLPRMQTSIIDSYLSPVLKHYLDEVSDAVGEDSLMLMHSAGGLEYRHDYFAKDSLLSGPAAGVKGVEAVGTLTGFTKTIGFDMGGTSTDVCRVDVRPDLRFEHTIGDATLFAPMLAIETVAAGGGSICGIKNGELFVGPESAGAFPGPACYGAGGPLTITDVNLLLGRLHEEGFGIPINKEHSQRALDAIAREWNQDPNTLLDAWIQLANERMSETIRRISVRKGYDPADYALVSFGGAGGQHACAIARILGIKTILFPLDAGLLSAWGLRFAQRERVIEKQVLQSLEQVIPSIKDTLHSMLPDSSWHLDQLMLGLRFEGMDSVEWIAYRDGIDPKDDFIALFERIYGYLPDRPIEVESIRAQIKQSAHPHSAPTPPKGTSKPLTNPYQQARVDGSWKEIPILDRTQIKTGQTVKEPCLILDPYSTIYLEPSWQLSLLPDGSLQARFIAETSKLHTTGDSDLTRLSLDAARLQSIALEMGEQLQRTALSVNVKERLDFSCALLDPDGYLVVNAPHIPVHLGALGMCVRSVLSHHTLEPGDVIITNHPAYGGSHLPDVTAISGVFDSQNKLLGYVANRAHHAEIGGTRPGSMPPNARCLAEEGVVIPPMYLFKAGVARWADLEDLFRSAPYPSRNFAENKADLLAAVAANRLGASRLNELAKHVGSHRLLQSMRDLKQHASDRMLEEMKAWKFDHMEAFEYLDDGSCIHVDYQYDGFRLKVDFSGTSPVHPGNLNAGPAIVHSALMYVLRTLIDDALPLNEGVLDPVDIILPPSSMLNPDFEFDPWKCPAVVGGNVETSQRLVDTLLKPFNRVACSQGTMNSVLFGNDSFGFYETICGGTGAGPDFEGASGVHHHMTNTRITDPEIIEWRYPVRVEEFSIRRGSGGQGRFKGGDGVRRVLRFKEKVEISILSQHRQQEPYGILGGEPGSKGSQWIERSHGQIEQIKGIDQATLQAGDALIIETPGGGGAHQK